MSKHIGSAIGMNTIERIDRVRAVVDRLGFRMGKAQYASFGETENADNIALYPKDDCLPIYSRDACLFTGNLSELEYWIKGLDWARQYDSYLGAVSDKRREQYEAREVARQERIRYNKARAETFNTLKKEYK
jgi:hypothetical protein